MRLEAAAFLWILSGPALADCMYTVQRTPVVDVNWSTVRWIAPSRRVYITECAGTSESWCGLSQAMKRFLRLRTDKEYNVPEVSYAREHRGVYLRDCPVR
jgi:hypothetical protein